MTVEEFQFSDLLKQAEKTGFSALPPNEYDVTIDQAEARTTGSGKRKITVRMKVTSGPHQGRLVFNDHVLSPGNPNALVIFFRQMQAMGHNSEYFAGNPGLDQVAKDLIGRNFRVKLGVRTWENVERNSVLAIMPPASGTAAPVPGFTGTVRPVPTPAGTPPVMPAPTPMAAVPPVQSAPPVATPPVPDFTKPPVAAVPDPEPEAEAEPEEEAPSRPKAPDLPF